MGYVPPPPPPIPSDDPPGYTLLYDVPKPISWWKLWVIFWLVLILIGGVYVFVLAFSWSIAPK